MTNAEKHKNDSCYQCLNSCANLRLAPCDYTGAFMCRNKNTPWELKMCDNYVTRKHSIDDGTILSYELAWEGK